jgi:hypothetical protein
MERTRVKEKHAGGGADSGRGYEIEVAISDTLDRTPPT